MRLRKPEHTICFGKSAARSPAPRSWKGRVEILIDFIAETGLNSIKDVLLHLCCGNGARYGATLRSVRRDCKRRLFERILVEIAKHTNSADNIMYN